MKRGHHALLHFCIISLFFSRKMRSLLTTSRYIFVNAIEKLEECNNFQLQPSGVTGREQNEK